MVERGELYWADLGAPAGRRPVCVLSRNVALHVLNSATCAAVTRTIRGVQSEVEVGESEGLPKPSVISCDNIQTLRQELLDREPIGKLDIYKRAELDRALRYALDIVY